MAIVGGSALVRDGCCNVGGKEKVDEVEELEKVATEDDDGRAADDHVRNPTNGPCQEKKTKMRPLPGGALLLHEAHR